MKILVIKIGAIGDLVMSLSVVTAIQATYPNAHITWVVGKTAAPVVSIIDGVSEVIVVDDKKLLKGNIFVKLVTLFEIWIQIFAKKFDLVLNYHADSRYKLISLPHYFSNYRSFSKGQNERVIPVPGRHHSDEYARLALGTDTSMSTSYEIPFPNLSKIIIPNINEIDKNHKLITISPGGAKNIMRDDHLRRWKIENYVKLSNLLISADYQVAIIGSTSDEWVLPYFKELKIINLLGKFDLPQLVKFLQTADLMITHDSGPLHLAGLARCKIIAIFGSTNPYEKVPRTNENTILWGGENLACRPCYDGKEFANCSLNICMQSITPHLVFEKSVKVLSAKNVDSRF